MGKPAGLGDDAKGYYDPDLNQVISEVPIITPGGVVQVVSSTLTSTASGSGTSESDSGLTATITPKSANSKIYINGYITVGTSSFFAYCYLCRADTTIFKGDTAGSRPTVTVANTQHMGSNDIYNFEAVPFNYLDSPNTTSATTYKIKMRHYTTGTWYVNRTHRDRDTSGYEPRGTSVMTLMEIGGE
tara:strand:+ start:57 stop:617 length:561 start_codon:yes stop_codon:yes gene_type:complete